MSVDRNLREQKPAALRVKTRIVKDEQRQIYYDARATGAGKLAACDAAGVTPKTGQKWEKQWVDAGNPDFEQARITGPRTTRQINPDAREALKNFSLFQERYLGRVALPWQKTCAEQLVRLARSPEREFIVINLAPGSGKSTLVTHDIPTWMISKDRGIRICILSSTQSNAEKFADRIRRTLEATTAIKAPEQELRAGTAKDAKTTLAKDFGRFRPEEATTWTKKKFFVDRPAADESHKDATVEAYGKDQAFLGGRYDVVICDDVYDAKKTRTFEAKEEIKSWFSDVAESRLEPSGLMILVMQRVDPEDLSRYCLDMEAYDAEDDEEVDDEELTALAAEKERLGIDPLPVRDNKTRKYRHVIYPAHFEDECKGPSFHKLSAPAYPAGCLLYPRRLSYRDLMTKKKNDPAGFEIWFQQKDIDLANVLVDPLWIKGGRDEFGIERPGCWDHYRGARELPHGLSNDIFSFLTIDPSPSEYWAVEWWAYHRPSNELYLIDLVRQRMSSAAFFDMNPNNGDCTGVLVDMYEASRMIGLPLSHVVSEVNAAQKFMYDSSAIMQWMRSRSIPLMPHTTVSQNKNSTEFGVQSIQSWFRDGRIRLPGKEPDLLNGRTRALKLVDEATKYRLDGTTASTTDCVMACWFAVYSIDKLYRPKKEMPKLKHRPSWVGRPPLQVVA